MIVGLSKIYHKSNAKSTLMDEADYINGHADEVLAQFDTAVLA